MINHIYTGRGGDQINTITSFLIQSLGSDFFDMVWQVVPGVTGIGSKGVLVGINSCEWYIDLVVMVGTVVVVLDEVVSVSESWGPNYTYII